MDRNIVYPGAIPLDTDNLGPQLNTMVALGYLAQAMLGTFTVADGFACTPTSPATMSVNVAGGMIATNLTIDATAFGSISANANPLVKMGILATTSTFTLTAPGSGSQIYLISVAFLETDTSALILPYYNSANPAQSLNGPGNSGVAQNTTRAQRAVLTLTPGVASGSPAAPATPAGNIALYYITVTSATTSITAGMISRAPGSALASQQDGTGMRLGRLINTQTFTASGTYVPTPGTNSITVEGIGGGGGGSGCPSPGASNYVAGGGGAAGSYGKARIILPTQQTVTIGAGGAGGVGTSGSAGGQSSFGSLLIVPGGGGGQVGSAGSATRGAGGSSGAAASVSAGATLIVGSPGPSGIMGAGFNGVLWSGRGGSSIYGSGGQEGGYGVAGMNATGYGCGGAGACQQGTGSALNGGNGSAGIFIIYEYS
jgi:hypothetical protein